jgi:hypothetical protein
LNGCSSRVNENEEDTSMYLHAGTDLCHLQNQQSSVLWQLDLLEGKKFMADRGAKNSASNVSSPL